MQHAFNNGNNVKYQIVIFGDVGYVANLKVKLLKDLLALDNVSAIVVESDKLVSDEEFTNIVLQDKMSDWIC